MNDLIKNVHPLLYLLAVAYAVWFTAWVSVIVSYIRYFNEINRLMRSKTLNKNRSDVSRLMGGALYSKLSHGVEIDSSKSFDSTMTTSLSKSNILWAKKQASKYLPAKDFLFWLGLYQIIFLSMFLYVCGYLLPSTLMSDPTTYLAIMPGYMSMTRLFLLLCPALMAIVVAPFVFMSRDTY